MSILSQAIDDARYIAEALTIKLGGRDSSNSKAFVTDLHNTSEAHPINSRKRVLGNASVEVSAMGNDVHIHDILSHKPKSGAGTSALKHLTSLADKHGAKLTLTAKSYSSDKDKITSSRLIKWYKKHGFESDTDDKYEMIYYPK